MIFDDLVAHPGFTFLTLGAIAVAIVWMYYTTKTDEEKLNIMYAQLDLLYKILER
jgi:hypothetical protein